MYIRLLFYIIMIGSVVYALPEEEKTVKALQTSETLDKKRLEQWTETMNYGISDQRLSVIKKIRADKIVDALPLLESSFAQEKNQYVKEEIIYTFIDMGYKNNSQFWKTLFTNEENIVVLQRAAYAVEKLEISVGSELYQKLTNMLEDPQAMRFKASAVQALGQLKYKEALSVIQELAKNTKNHQDLRGAAVVALGMFQDASLIPFLQELLNSPIESRFIRRYASLSIGRTENPEAISILSPIALNEEEEQTVRVNSISGLGYLTINEELENTMQLLTKSDNTAIRTEAIKSLGKMKATNSKTVLEYKALNDPESIVRREAKIALQAMGLDVSTLEK